MGILSKMFGSKSVNLSQTVEDYIAGSKIPEAGRRDLIASLNASKKAPGTITDAYIKAMIDSFVLERNGMSDDDLKSLAALVLMCHNTDPRIKPFELPAFIKLYYEKFENKYGKRPNGKILEPIYSMANVPFKMNELSHAEYEPLLDIMHTIIIDTDGFTLWRIDE